MIPKQSDSVDIRSSSKHPWINEIVISHAGKASGKLNDLVHIK